MMSPDHISNRYFEWMLDLITKDRFAKDISYRKLLMRLHNTRFRYSIRNDVNRAEDGIDLRWRFALEENDKTLCDYLTGPCSVLEMILALAIKCEESIMDDPRMGNRTGQWFWGMMTNLGLGSMTDDRFDKQYVDDTIKRFLNRDYAPNGKGGLFTIRNCKYDLREVEIWFQLNWYLDGIV